LVRHDFVNPTTPNGSSEPSSTSAVNERSVNLSDETPVQAPRPTVDLRVALAALMAGDGTADMWQDRALCAETDPEAFYPDKGGSTREAKAVCARCDVRTECLQFALANDERFGIWGGMSERERRRLRRGPA
jgi:WhiB family redox-sensing transcriptional regulator